MRPLLHPDRAHPEGRRLRRRRGDDLLHVPAPFASGLEEQIVATVKEQLGETFPRSSTRSKVGSVCRYRRTIAGDHSHQARSDGRTRRLRAADRVPGRHRLRARRQALGLRDDRLPQAKTANMSRAAGCVSSNRPRATAIRQVDHVPRQNPVPDRRHRLAARACSSAPHRTSSTPKTPTATGKADVVKKLFTGFSTENPQAR